MTNESVDTSKIYMLGHSNGGMMTEAYSFTGDLMSLSSIGDTNVPVLGNASYKSDIFEYIQTRSDVANRTEYRTIGGATHTVSSM